VLADRAMIVTLGPTPSADPRGQDIEPYTASSFKTWRIILETWRQERRTVTNSLSRPTQSGHRTLYGLMT